MFLQDWKRALILFRQMEALSIDRDTVTYTNAIKACADGDQIDKAQTLFAYMEVAGAPRNTVTYAVMINAYVRAGEWQRGLTLLDEMLAKQVEPDGG